MLWRNRSPPQAALAGNQFDQVMMGVGVARVELDRPAIRGDGFGDVAMPGQGQAKVLPRRGVVRLEAGGLLEMTDGLVQPALVEQDRGEIDVGVWQVVVPMERLVV